MLCPEPTCGAPMRLRYARKFQRFFYGCDRFPQCRGTHGAHSDGRPLGTPATVAVKTLRVQAHNAFDPVWKYGPFPDRSAAYRWLAEELGLTKDQAHIGALDAAQCTRVIELCERLRKPLAGKAAL